MMAVEASPGIPSVNIGTIVPPVVPLFAVSGATTPSGSPLPKFSGFFELFFTTPYESQVAPSAPTPGTAPIKAPKKPPTVQARHLFKKSNVEGNSILNLVATSWEVDFIKDKSEITTANPNKPTKAAAKGTPDSKSIDPKVNLSIASVLSMPTAPINKPILTPINPFNIEPRVNAETITNPIIAIRAMSAFEDFRAILEIKGIQVTAIIQLVTPPKKEE